MPIQLSNSVKYLKGVGPQRAAVLEERGIVTVGDLLGYLPFRYEDRIRFTHIAEIIPGQVHTIFAEVSSGGAAPSASARSARAIFHVTVRDASGVSARTIFSRRVSRRTAQRRPAARDAWQSRSRSLPPRPHRDGESADRILSAADGAAADSTEVGRIVPIYEAIGGDQFAHAAANHLQRAAEFRRQHSRSAARRKFASATAFPSRREALLYAHFPPKNENIELLNSFRSPAQIRLIFEEFFYYQLALALRR